MAPAAAARSPPAWIPPAALPCRRLQRLAAASDGRRANGGMAGTAAASAVAGWVAITAPPRPPRTSSPSGVRTGSPQWCVGDGNGSGDGGQRRWSILPSPPVKDPLAGRAAGAPTRRRGAAKAPALPPTWRPRRLRLAATRRGDRQLILRSPTALAAELRRFSTSIGADPGEMPREADLLRHRRGDLRYAIRTHHGGYRAAASAAALRYTGAAAAGRYAHFSALAADLRTLIDARVANVPDARHAALAARYMPRVMDLLDAGRSDLVHAIAAHGGQHVVARRLGLHLHYHAVTHYRGDWGALVEEVWRFIAERDGVPTEGERGGGGVGTSPIGGSSGDGDGGGASAARGRFPTSAQLRAAGRLDLVAGIKAHGGAVAVASLLGLKLQVGRRRSESVAIGTAAAGVPAQATVPAAAAGASRDGHSGNHGSDAKLAWLALQLAAIAKAADDDGLSGVLRPTPTALSEEAAGAGWTTASGTATFVCAVMPSSTTLLRSGRVDVLRAISAAGGRAAVAAALGISHMDRSVLVEEWASADVVASPEALAYNGGNTLNARRLVDALPRATDAAADGYVTPPSVGTPSSADAAGCAPTAASADNCLGGSRGKAAVVSATTFPRPAEGVSPAAPSRQSASRHAVPPFDWEAGRGGGGGALLARHGGRRRPAHHWGDFSAVRTELTAFCYDNGSPGVMPTVAELAAAGRRDLVRGMARYGGLKAVADRLGWVRVSLSGAEARRRALRVAAQSPLRRGGG
ncbi:hypothetical protein MMPV_007359 [Pyropia vietnamensis]